MIVSLILPLKGLGKRSKQCIYIVAGITISLWLLAKFNSQQDEDLWPWRAPSQVLGLLSLSFMGLSLMVGARSHMLEWLFGGLDNAVKTHRKLGALSLFLLIIHLLLLIPVWVSNGKPVLELFIPFYNEDARTPDIFVFWGFIALAILVYNKSLPYQKWQWIHRINGLLFTFFSAHVLMVPGSISSYEPLRTWMIFIGIVGTVSFLYRAFFFKRFGPRFEYKVSEVILKEGGVYDLFLSPIRKRMIYYPGSFAFISVPKHDLLPNELHPFTISSTPVNNRLRFSIRSLGDYTSDLCEIEAGTAVDVYGPFGSFTPFAHIDRRRIILIGAGIGITPFLSMLSFELTNDYFRRIWLFYLVDKASNASYDQEIKENCLKADSFIEYELWSTEEKGYANAKSIQESIGDMSNYAVMLCGSNAFVESFSKQFQELGLPKKYIITEQFAFR